MLGLRDKDANVFPDSKLRKPRVALVTTTINVPTVLKSYCENIRKHGHLGDTIVIVAGDQNTSIGCRPFCERVQKETGVPIVYLGLEEQDKLLEPFSELKEFLPWKCIQRRNVAFLYAYLQDIDYMITIDDDNHMGPAPNPMVTLHHGPSGHVKMEVKIEEDVDFIQAHIGRMAAHNTKEQIISTSTPGWYNVCNLCVEKNGISFYHRGFPMSWREGQMCKEALKQKEEGHILSHEKVGEIVVNAGLWLGDPDVDAIARLAHPLDVTKVKLNMDLTGVVLGKGTWCPFNSQNTAVRRDVLEAYMMIVGVGRMDDIWASVVVRRIMDHLGHSVRYGFPLTVQTRNPHNLFRDYENEAPGLEFADELFDHIRNTPLTGIGYHDCLNEIIESISRYNATLRSPSAPRRTTLNAQTYLQWVDNLLTSLHVWHATIARAKKMRGSSTYVHIPFHVPAETTIFHPGKKTLVCCFGVLRTPHYALSTLKTKLLEPYHADLLLCVDEGIGSTRDVYAKEWKEAATYYIDCSSEGNPESIDVCDKEWLAAYRTVPGNEDAKETPVSLASMKQWAPGNWLGPAYNLGNGGAGAGLAMMMDKAKMAHYIRDKGLHHKYDQFIITRTDFVYVAPVPVLEKACQAGQIHVPAVGHWEGINDRWMMCHSSDVLTILSQVHYVGSGKFMDEAKKANFNVNGINSERCMSFYLQDHLKLKVLQFELPAFLSYIEGKTQNRGSRGTYYSAYNVHAKYIQELAGCFAHGWSKWPVTRECA